MEDGPPDTDLRGGWLELRLRERRRAGSVMCSQFVSVRNIFFFFVVEKKHDEGV